MTGTERYLLADIGGTNVRFATAAAGEQPTDFATSRSDDYPSLFDAARAYLDRLPAERRPAVGAFGVASPATEDKVTFTNRAWSFSIKELRRGLGFDRLHVVNDFVAVAMSVPCLTMSDLVQIGPTGAVEEPEVLGVLGAGTGLGTAAMIRIEGKWRPLAAEGGHVTMAPFDDRESEILRVLRRRLGHISAERVISGQGLTNLHQALAELDGAPCDPVDPSVITESALSGADPRMGEATAIFCRMLGTVASNLALTLGARGGIYIGGGIVPRLGRFFETSDFRRRFEDKGRFRPYLKAIPTLVITHEAPALLGLRTIAENG